MKKNYTFHLTIENMNRLNELIKFPCSKSDMVDEIVNYLLKSPWIITELLNNKLDRINIITGSVRE